MTTWLSTLDEERLHRVLRDRPDAAAAPEPRALGELADRLQRPGSVALAVARLPLPALQVAEAVAALGEHGDRAALAALLGQRDERAVRRLDEALTTLADHALVWPADSDELRMATALREAWETPLGLGQPLEALLSAATSEDLRSMLTKLGVKAAGNTKAARRAALREHYGSAERILAVVAKAPPRTRQLLERRAAGPPAAHRGIVFGSPDPAPGADSRWAEERGLLMRERHGYGRLRMPAEVALALRGPEWRAPFDAEPPTVDVVPVGDEEVAREAAAAAGAFAARAASVLKECADRPLAVLKSGGVGVRELGRLAKATRCDEPLVRLVLECAHASGLLSRAGNQVVATKAYDAWAEHEPAERLVTLLRAWWGLPMTPTGARDEEGKPVPAMAPFVSCAGCVQARRGLGAALRGLPEGHGAARPPQVGTLIPWHRPMADELPQDSTPFASLIGEATTLGVLAAGALSPLGAALLDDDPAELAERAGRLLPPAVSRVRFGSDLTAVAMGTPSTRLMTLLDSVADRESDGTASLWRFSPASVRRAMDAGHGAAEIEGDLAAVTDQPLPQPLSYLIADTARRHGQLRVVSALCVVVGEEPGLIAELAAHRRLAKLGLRRVAPTVVVADATPKDTLAALRTEGYAPVAESVAGTLRVERPPTERAPAPLPRPRTAPVGEPELRALAAGLVRGPVDAREPDQDREIPYDSDTEELLASNAGQLPLADRRQLAHAIHEGGAVTIAYVSGAGAHTVRTLSELDFDPPFLYAWCHLREDDRVFALGRIQSVMPAAATATG
ncbi:helicase-associated domain-containing protein [Streptomyces sp. 8K308]|uniref:helicase-associated domain-containing protein n=1 Tax=Streptomyces sp. 8K308 TaxID=2530388 RepID=UPI003265792D